MKFINRVRPNYRAKISTQRIMRDLTIALTVLVFAAVYYYTKTFGFNVGKRVLYVTLTAVLVNIAIELLFGLIQKKSVKEVFTQQFPWVTGLIFALAIPVTTTLYVVGMTTAIGVIFGKVLFGGFGQNIFNPAGIGRAVVGSSFSNAFLKTLFTSSDVYTSATPAQVMNSFNWLPSNDALASKAFEALTLKDVALGNHFGAIGETFAVLIIILGIFLAIRKVIDWRIPVVYIGTLFVSAWIIGLVNGVTSITYPLVFIFSGGALFGAVFMLTDPVTCPTQRTGRVVFAFGAAIITLIIRFKANLPEGVVFSILIMNMLTPLIEDLMDGQQTRLKKRYLYSTLTMVLIAAVSIGWISTTVVVAEPQLDLGSKVAMDDKEVLKYKVLDIQSKADGSNTEFTVSVQGYGLKAEFPKPEYKENIFVVVVDSSNKIVSAKMEQFGDTAGIGDVINDDLYFSEFVGKDLSNPSEELDTVSGATVSSYSFISALHAISEELGE